MASNNLKDILSKEGITQKQYAAETLLSAKLLDKICKQRKTPSPVTMVKMVDSINKLAGSKYSVNEIFPTYSV